MSRPFKPRGKSMTKQAFGDESDINTIVGKFLSTGSLDWFNRREPRFGDFTGVGDYHQCLNRVAEAQEAFDALPAKVRAHFSNDPGELVAAAFDPERREELRGLGFVPLGEAAPPLPGGQPEADSDDDSEADSVSPSGDEKGGSLLKS